MVAVLGGGGAVVQDHPENLYLLSSDLCVCVCVCVKQERLDASLI